ncbi:glycosyltransferase family 2 protein [Paracrocinitomix mangrovi]|uniref:glycosyltransferase family 2 protein n=1 Tax=Paracrocinitomix mangrovi TaxID=2862509 RepID=UPI001C8DCD7F|nr:glycosyltransferase family 2 protein [Paracrocinitomix mangrovi]UKN02034.1 glycosyltransferase family 2 protein [Paracrocinitomix mangrovi]
MKIAVVILNYNGKDYLDKFLPSVIQNSADAEIWVVDNCSTDDSVSFLQSEYPQIHLVENESNGGFAKGYNDGLKKIEADYYVLLNSDVEVTPNWIQPCIELFQQDDKIAALQPKILAEQNRHQFEHAGAAGGFLDKNYFPFCRGRIFDIVEEDKGQFNDTKEVFWATGACLFIKADLFHQMGGFDEDFFAHMEEIDLCWRLKRHGYKIYYCGHSTVYHVGGGTLNYMHPRKTYLNFRNSLYTIYKNHEGSLSILFRRMVLDGIAASLFLLKFQFKHFWAVFKAHMSLYANLKSLKKKRNALKQSTSTFNAVGLYNKNITFKKFLGGVKYFKDLKDSDFKS